MRSALAVTKPDSYRMDSPVDGAALSTCNEVVFGMTGYRNTSLNTLLAGVAALTLLVAVGSAGVQAQPAANATPANPAGQPPQTPSATANPPPAKPQANTPSTAAAPPAASVNGPTEAAQKPSKITPPPHVLISVDQSTQHMRVSVNGRTRYDFPVSTGRPGYNTPDGKFAPQWMARMHYSKKYEDAPMPHSIFFVSGDAIHGFTNTPFGAAAVSHGCVRLPLADATAVFNLVNKVGMDNTTIYVHGRIPNRPMVAQRQPQSQYPNHRYGGDWGYSRYSENGYPPPPFFVRPFLGGPYYYGGQGYERPPY